MPKDVCCRQPGLLGNETIGLHLKQVTLEGYQDIHQPPGFFISHLFFGEGEHGHVGIEKVRVLEGPTGQTS